MNQERVLPLIPVSGLSCFLGCVEPFILKAEPVVRAVEEVMHNDKMVLFVGYLNSTDHEIRADNIYSIGFIGNVLQCLKLPDGSCKILIQAESRVRIDRVVSRSGYFVGEFLPHPFPRVDFSQIRPKITKIWQTCKELHSLEKLEGSPESSSPLIESQSDEYLKVEAAIAEEDSSTLLNALSHIVTSDPFESQVLLEAPDRLRQLEMICNITEDKIKKTDGIKPNFKPHLHEIFISHCGEDKARIAEIVKSILNYGFRVFVDRPESIGLKRNALISGINSGPFRQELSEALKRCSCVLAIWSEKAVEPHRTEMHEEAAYGKSNARLVQVSIDSPSQVLKQLPLGFKEWQLFDISESIGIVADSDSSSFSHMLSELQDVSARNLVTNSPLAAWEQASKAVSLQVIEDKLRAIERPPPDAPKAPINTLNALRDRFISRLQKIETRLQTCQHPIEEDIRQGAHEIIRFFDCPLEEIDPILAPSVGEQVHQFDWIIRDEHVRKEIADHLVLSVPVAAQAYRDFLEQWSAWKDQLNDPAIVSVTPQNADRTRAAADLVTEFARNSPEIIHEDVPIILDAMRRLIHPEYGSSQYNDYRYLNAIGEGLREIWNSGSRYLVKNWGEISSHLDEGSRPNMGPFNEFLLEMKDALQQLSASNPDLFGWLNVRIGYLIRLESGSLYKL